MTMADQILFAVNAFTALSSNRQGPPLPAFGVGPASLPCSGLILADRPFYFKQRVAGGI
jgi:hypothetical protein